MGLFSAISQWKIDKQEKHVENMKTQNKCPDCYGRGFIMPVCYDYVYPYDCTGCNGSGSYDDWVQNQHI
ncbi:hypothetical protein [Heyndrickxia ginsengihumi]|uniref:Methionine aminopeptidase n=1 Tax=Heyndrickxia ginsengihumi TaxID=363870 RepID=A0A0A6XZZ4_9BACI|nr:hypothetical protein [Heyndrickxia ginsengihumi]KHD85657.1 methionine aminopeptidase [Heyndrickxia ginsengihumi]MBE6184123.1 methionine aminopeptidase [Bacillus sp. (in: firmicutes)]MCM3024905.1 methionine aminopeptidase [Heyndrickxia ginsengihumi]NEY20538.1 methionine aminopeptidase [Heyndrickxia ginsengihumi]